jgi:hypothetical protein
MSTTTHTTPPQTETADAFVSVTNRVQMHVEASNYDRNRIFITGTLGDHRVVDILLDVDQVKILVNQLTEAITR